MLKSRAFLVFLILIFLSAWAQGPLDSDRLFSPSVSQSFYEVAYELARSEDGSGRQAEQAIIFLTATANLDSGANYILPDMIKLACRHSNRDNSELVYRLLASYVDEFADLEVEREAVRYLLDRLSSREEREKLLKEMLENLGGRNKVFDSELATLLGLLMAEKADWQAAQYHFMHAFNSNKYNKLAFAKLAELVPEQIGPAMYLEHLRLALGENPLDMEAALGFAQYAERLQLYQTAADAYRYCVDLFRFLHPSQDLPASLYLPWAISTYNTKRNPHECLQIAAELRQSDRFDLLLEAIAGKAAAKIGDAELASRILRSAEGKALADTEKRLTEQLAWFYCFALPDADKALNWANKAHSTEPSSTTTAILAYALVMNGQIDSAKSLIDDYDINQIATLAMAQIQLADGQQSSAIETLKSAIAADPGSLEAERAKEILAQHGREYLPPIDPAIILTALRNSLRQAVVPTFVGPEKIISVRLNVRGTEFPYGSSFDASIAVTNNSSQPIVVSNDSLFSGNIRVDADISGDINKKIPNLISARIRTALLIAPGRSILIPLRLVTAELRQILLNHPQAFLDIEFTVYIDPVITADGKLTNRLRYIKPVKMVVNRPGIELTGRFLQNRLNSLSMGRQGQKVKTAELFVGLLMEQHAMADRKPPYKFMYADWMPALLESALLHNLTNDDWVVKTQTMTAMLTLPLNYELISSVAENLNDTHWPVRMMAISLLARYRDGDYDKVLDWTAKYDTSKLVRDMAVALGAANPEVQEQANRLSTGDSKKQSPSSKD